MIQTTKNIELEVLKDILREYLDDESMINILLNDFEDFFNKQSQKFKLLFFCLIKKQISTEILNEEEIFDGFLHSVLLNRLENDFLIDCVDKQGKFKVYKLSEKGIKKVNQCILKQFLELNYEYQSYIKEKRLEKLKDYSSEDKIKQISKCLIDSHLRPKQDNMFYVDMREIAEWNYELLDVFYENMNESISIIEEFLKNYFPECKNSNSYGIKFINIHDSERIKIPFINMDYKGLIFTKGLITSKKESIISKTIEFHYLCTDVSCKFSNNKLKSIKQLKKFTCPNCKSKIDLIDTINIDQLQSKITDIDSGISLKTYIRSKLIKDFAYYGLGDEIEVIGYLEDYMIESKNDTIETEKVLVLNNFWKTDIINQLNQEDKEDITNFLEKEEKLNEYLLSPFVNYIEQEWIKKLFILQQLTTWNPAERETPIHIALMGESGIGKNEMIKVCEEFFPNVDSVAGADITDAGFKGTVNRDTGIKEIGLAKQCQHGTIFLNEFDKFVKANNNGKKYASQLLNATITEQEIRLNKAGIKIKMENLNLRQNVVFNPLDTKYLNKEINIYNEMAEILDKSLLSRMLPLYIGRDDERSNKVFELMLSSKKKITTIDKEKYKKIILYLRNFHIEFTKKGNETLLEIFKELKKKDNSQVVSIERLAQMLIQICKAVCRFHYKKNCGKQEVQEAYNIYLKCLDSVGINLDNLEMLFIEDNIEELRKKITLKDLVKDLFKNTKTRTEEELRKLLPTKALYEKIIDELKNERFFFENKKGLFVRLD